MAFAQEVRDFLSAFSTMRQAFGSKADREEQRSQTAYRDTMRRKAEWDMGAEDRENARIVDFARNRTGGGIYDAGSYGDVESGEFDPGAASQAIADIESSGGNYEAKGPVVTMKNGQKAQAYGKYQVMDFNIPNWTAQYVGRAMSPEEFLRDPDAQERVFAGEFGRLAAKHGSVADAASIWFTGRPFEQASAAEASDGYTHVNDYVNRFLNGYNKYAGRGGSDMIRGGSGEDTFESTPEEIAAIPVLPADEDTGEWNEADEATAIPAGPDDMGTSDPDYIKAKEERGYTDLTVPVQSGVVAGQPVQELIEEPGTTPVSNAPEVEAPTEEEIADAASARARPTAIDPLPQTSGHTDRVSASGHESMSPTAQVLTTRNRGKTPFKTIIGEATRWGMNAFGLSDEGIDTQSDSGPAEAYLSGLGGVNVGLVQQVEQAIDPNMEMSEDQRQLEVMSTMWEYYMSRGEPEKAKGVTFGLYQTYKQVSQRYAALGRRYAEEGDWEEAADNLLKAYSIVPDGYTLDAVTNEDGSMTIRTLNADTDEVLNETVIAAADLPKFIMERAMNIGPGDFDALVMRAVTGQRPGAGEDDAADQAFMQEFYGTETAIPEGDTGGEVPMTAPDVGGVSTGRKDNPTSEVTSEDPEGGTAIPDAAAPTQPMSLDQLRKQLSDATARGVSRAGRNEMIQFWQLQQKQYADWLKTQVSPEEQAAADTVANFWTALSNQPEDQNFNPPEEAYAAAGSAEAINAMRQAAQFHNEEAERIRKEGAQTNSTSVLNELLADLYHDPELGTEIPAGVESSPIDQTVIEGEYDQTREPIAWNAEKAAQLNPDELKQYQVAWEKANADIKAQNDKLNTPRANLPSGTDAAQNQDALIQEALNGYFERATQNAKSPEEAQAYDILKAGITKHNAVPYISAGARDLMATDGNAGMNEDIAASTALSMLAIIPSKPGTFPYKAERVPDRPGIIKLTPNIGRGSPVFMSESAFVALDAIREKMVTDFINEQGRASAQAANAAELEQKRKDTSIPLEEQYDEENTGLKFSVPNAIPDPDRQFGYTGGQ